MQQQQMGQITQQPQQLRAEQGIEEVAEQQKLDLIWQMQQIRMFKTTHISQKTQQNQTEKEMKSQIR